MKNICTDCKVKGCKKRNKLREGTLMCLDKSTHLTIKTKQRKLL